MGNYSVIDLADLFSQYGIELKRDMTRDELARMKAAFETAKNQNEFIVEVKRILAIGENKIMK